MGSVRRSILAGSWYPIRSDECEKEIVSFLEDTSIKATHGTEPIGGIVPHAGWHFSGSIACNVIHQLTQGTAPDVFVIFGMHLHPNSPAYIMKAGAWETPFGDLAIETSLAESLADVYSFQVETADDFTQDNTIELQLPFIKYFCKDAGILPIGVPPRASSIEVGSAVVDIAHRLGLTVKVIGSTDLTHYGRNFRFTPKGSGPSAVEWVRSENDRKIIDIMLKMDPEAVITEALAQQNACCSGAAAAAIAAVRKLGAESAETIAYATSYDKNPDSSFVGYAGVLFF